MHGGSRARAAEVRWPLTLFKSRRSPQQLRDTKITTPGRDALASLETQVMFASFRTRTASRFTCVALIILIASLLTFSPRARAQTAPVVVVVDLGTLGGSNSRATAVNASGHIVGTSQTATGEEHAFLWTPNGGMVDLERSAV